MRTIFKADFFIGRAIAFLLPLMLFPASVYPWSRLGHRIAAEFAESRLSPSALSAIHNLLGPNVSLADVSTWADEQREIPGSSSWHYVNVPLTESRYDPKYCQRGGCTMQLLTNSYPI